MHISTIVRDCAWFKYLRYREAEEGQPITWKHYLAASTSLALSLLHGTAFIGAMYLSLDIVFSQYELTSPLPTFTIIFTALYGVTELIFGADHFYGAFYRNHGTAYTNNLQSIKENEDSFILAFIFTNRIGMAGMIACAIAGAAAYLDSHADAPCMLKMLSEKIRRTPEMQLSPEIIAVSISTAVAVLLGLYILSVVVRDKTVDNDATFETIVKSRTMTELEGFVAPCFCKSDNIE